MRVMGKRTTMYNIFMKFLAALAMLFFGMLTAMRYGPRGTQKSAIYEYDFAIDGGLVSTINLRLIAGDAPPPATAIIDGKNVAIDVLTALTSGGAATAGLQLEAGGDVQAAVVVSGAPWSTTGMKDPSLEAPLKSAGGAMRLVIGVAALTAGKFRVYVSYNTLT